MNHSKIKLIVLSGLFAALTATGALLRIPFYPVPFTLQTLFTALAGLVLPAQWAMLSQVVYLLMGLLGLPVFANGGGIGYIMQPTFGYLLFLPVSAFLIATVRSSVRPRSLFQMTLWVSLCSFTVLIGGALWLFLNLAFVVEKDVSFLQTIYSGMIIFIPALILKSFLSVLLWNVWKKRF